MNKEFIPYEQALALKELGFDEPCFGWFTKYGTFYEGKITIHQGVLLAPLYQQAFKFFREKYGMCAHIKPENNEEDVIVWEYVILTISDSEVCFTIRKSNYSLSEEAEIACLTKLIEIVKNK